MPPPHGGPDKDFHAFCTEGPSISDCDFEGAQVAVTPKMNHPQLRFNPEIETCTKDDENQNCFGEGVGNTYSRDANRDWMISTFVGLP